ncbi:MAG: redoxin domain-containing protein [Planctomycetes bacterium]|nr:redoxin domain-containing protein [Planctomycetota bacterium]
MTRSQRLGAILAPACVLLCVVAAPGRGADAGTTAEDPPTFAGAVARIVFDNCASCHRPGEVGPFPLLSYEEVRKRGKMIERVVARRLMPPWHPVEGHGEFADELGLTDREIATIEAWVAADMPEGDKSKTPPLPKFTDGWQLGAPDVVVKMPKGYTVPAGGPDIYRNFAIPLGFKEDRWLTAIEVRPGARAVLHHLLFFLDETGEARKLDGQDGTPGFRKMLSSTEGQLLGADTAGLGGWAVGGMPRHLPQGLARKVPKGSDLVLQSHLHPSGKAEVEQTVLGLHFADSAPKRSMANLQLPPLFGVAAGIDIPADEKAFKLRDHFELPVDAEAVMVGGHAHMLCQRMQLWVTPPGQERESLFLIDQWDFDWQNQYQYREPMLLPKGTRVEVELEYDNSSDNPNNPHDPPQRVRWGEETTDEMGSITLLLTPRKESDAEALQAGIRRGRIASMARNARKAAGPGGGGLLEGLAKQVLQFDVNKDGTVSADEIPAQFRPMIGRLDTNGDGAIDAQELAALTGEEAAPAAAGGGPESPGSGPAVMGADGQRCWPLDTRDRIGNVVIFTTVDCPIANAYAPEINRIVSDYRDKPLKLYLVHVDPDVTAERAQAHAREYGFAATVLLDSKQELAKKLGVKVTPEAVLVKAGAKVAYQGRIDDQWGDLQKKRPAPTKRDLRVAIEALLSGKPISTAKTKAIGCDLPELPKGE